MAIQRTQWPPFELPELVKLFTDGWCYVGGASRVEWWMTNLSKKPINVDHFHKFNVIRTVPVFDETFQSYFPGDEEEIVDQRIQYGFAGTLQRIEPRAIR